MKSFFNFEHPEYLWALGAIVLFLLLFFFEMLWRRSALRRIGDPALVTPLLQRRSRIKPIIRMALFSIGFSGVVAALCNPRAGAKEKKITSSGIDIVVVFDVSNSMYAADQQPDRLGAAKAAVQKIIQHMHGDRVGVVIFAGDAFTHLPITTDYSSAMQSIKELTPDDIAAQGTALGGAIDQAMKTFGETKEDDIKHSKAIIVVSDGEGHDDNVTAAVDRAVQKGVIICTIGVGTEAGAPVPEYTDGLPSGLYKMDESGHTVMTHLNTAMMKDIAARGKGIYIHADDNPDVSPLFSYFNSLPKVESVVTDYKDFEDLYFWWALGAFALLLVESTIGDRTYKFLEKKKDPFEHARKSAS